MSSAQLFPEIQDATQVGGVFTENVYLGIGVEGVADDGGSATVGQPYEINRPSEAVDLFGDSSLTDLVTAILTRGVAPVWAAASIKGDGVELDDRQAAWQNLETLRQVRIRMTDSVASGDIAALATSCDNANLMSNKQFGIAGMARATAKSALTAAAEAMNHSRMVLVGPGVDDTLGNELSGLYGAAAVAAAVSKNNNPADDLDLLVLDGLTDVERDSQGMPLFRQLVESGVLTNDFEDLLQSGVSPLMAAPSGGVAITHLTTTYRGAEGGDDTYDALMTRIIADQSFVLVRNHCEEFLYLRKGNTDTNRKLLAIGIEKGVLYGISDWLRPVVQSDGTLGYNVAVVASPDERQMIVTYEGHIVRGVQTILVSPTLTVNV